MKSDNSCHIWETLSLWSSLFIFSFHFQLSAMKLKKTNRTFKKIFRVSSHIGGIYAEGGCPSGTALSFRTRGPNIQAVGIPGIAPPPIPGPGNSHQLVDCSYTWKLNLHVCSPTSSLLNMGRWTNTGRWTRREWCCSFDSTQQVLHSRIFWREWMDPIDVPPSSYCTSQLGWGGVEGRGRRGGKKCFGGKTWPAPGAPCLAHPPCFAQIFWRCSLGSGIENVRYLSIN